MHDLHAAVVDLLRELIDGPPGDTAYVLNPGDPGLLASLRRLSADEANLRGAAGASVGAHADHVRYGLELLNRWSRGEDPWSDANWSAAWQRERMDDAQWRTLLDDLEREARAWMSALGRIREASRTEWCGAAGSVVHIGYHLGAIRQMVPKVQGPRERS